MYKKTIKLSIVMLLMLVSLNVASATMVNSNIAVGIRDFMHAEWLYTSYSYSIMSAVGYSVPIYIYFDVDKQNYNDYNFVTKFSYLKAYSWYNPPFMDSYDGVNPIIIDYCMAIADTPDEPSVPVYNEQNESATNVELRVDFRRNFNDWIVSKSNTSACGGSLKANNYGCWSGLIKIYCYMHIDEEYLNNDAVKEYYNWTNANPPAVYDIIPVTELNGCRNGDEQYCLFKFAYPFYLDKSYFPGSAYDSCIKTCWLDTSLNKRFNLTLDQYQKTQAEHQNPTSGGNCTSDPSNPCCVTNSCTGNTSSEAGEDEAEGNTGTGSGSSGGNEGGYQYQKLEDVMLERELILEEQSYLEKMLALMKLLYSFVILVFYFIEFSVIIYFFGTLIPKMFKQIIFIIKRSGRI